MRVAEVMKSLTVGLRILRVVEMAEKSVSAQEMIQLLELPRSTVYRLLKTLADQGFIEQTASGFIPGLYLTQTSRNSYEQRFQSVAGRDALSAIAQTLQETVVLTVIRWPHAYALAAVEGPRAVRWSFTAGTRHPLYAGASAKVLLAYLPDDALADYQQMTPFVPVSDHGPQCWDDVQHQILQIRSHGYCMSHGEVDEGVAALALPVHLGRRLVGSVSVVGPEFRFTPNDHVATLQKMVARIEEDLGDN